MTEIPVEIDDGETIVRVVKTPHHLNKGKLRPSAFRPPAGESCISVMRQIMTDDFCKNKAVELFGAAYAGLAVILAGRIRSHGSSVVDARDEWLGHAHVDHGFKSPPNEPSDADEFQRMTERCKALANACIFHVDPSPAVSGWAGSQLGIAST